MTAVLFGPHTVQFPPVLRIAINAALIGKRHSGVTAYILGLIQCFSDLGHDVIVYASSPQIPSGIRITLARCSTKLRFDAGSVGAISRFIWNQAILPFRLLNDRVDLLVCQNTDGLLWCSTPQLLVIHDLIPALYPDEAPRLHRYYKMVLPLMLRRIGVIGTVSWHTKNDLVQHYKLDPRLVQVIYNAPSADLADHTRDRRPSALQSERYFLFVGTFAPRKNLHTVTKAFASVVEEVGESLVVVAYPDQWMEEYLGLVKSLGLKEKVNILSGLEDGEIAYLYRQASALFLLSEYEGFGLPPIEAMSVGTPAVVSDSGALAEVAGDAAIKVKAHDVDATAEVMRNLSQDKAFRDQWRERGLKRSELFRWERTRAQLQEVLRQFS